MFPEVLAYAVRTLPFLTLAALLALAPELTGCAPAEGPAPCPPGQRLEWVANAAMPGGAVPACVREGR